MTYGFTLLTVGTLFLYSGWTNEPISSVLQGLAKKGPGGTSFAAFLSGAGNAVTPGTGGEGSGFSGSPKSKTAAIARGVAKATSLSGRFPYVWGGGHGQEHPSGYDCSGAVSAVLIAMGVLERPMTSGELATWGKPGPGKYVTVYANATHTFMKINGAWFGTGSDKQAKRGGPAWGNHDPELSAYSVRHPKGF